jgi:hypothetical protein
MAESAEYDFEKLAREITASRLKEVVQAPAAAAEIASRIIVSGIASTKQRQNPRLTVLGVCRGVISGMLLGEKDLVATSVEILKKMAHLAQETHQDPADMMTWAMEGIAGVVVIAGPDIKLLVREALENNFMGTGEIFGELCAKAEASRRS